MTGRRHRGRHEVEERRFARPVRRYRGSVDGRTLSVGYWALVVATMLMVTAGFVGVLLLWLVWPDGGTWAHIRAP